MKNKYVCHGLISPHVNFHDNRTKWLVISNIKISRWRGKGKRAQLCFNYHAKFHCFMTTLNRLFKIEIQRRGDWKRADNAYENHSEELFKNNVVHLGWSFGVVNSLFEKADATSWPDMTSKAGNWWVCSNTTRFFHKFTNHQDFELLWKGFVLRKQIRFLFCNVQLWRIRNFKFHCRI